MKAKQQKLLWWVHKEGSWGTQGTVYQNRGWLMRCQSWGISPNVRKSSFSTLIQQQRRIPGWEMMGAEEWRGGELHTCRMICHYGGVSSQLSPPNHPTYPASPPPFAPQTPLQLSKNTSCIPQPAPVSPGALLPHLPLLPTLYPERKCTPVRETAHWAHCVNVQCECFWPRLCQHNLGASIYVYLTADLFVLLRPRKQNFLCI